MLKTNKGVAELSLWAKDYTFSYMSDVPIDILTKVYSVLNGNEDANACVLVGEDGNDYILVFTNSSSYIIEEKTSSMDWKDISIKTVAKMLINDISNDIESWANFIPTLSLFQVEKSEKQELDEGINKRKLEIKSIISEIKKYL